MACERTKAAAIVKNVLASGSIEMVVEDLTGSNPDK